VTGDAETKDQYIDEEWVTLIKEAYILGISADEIRDFFKKKREKEESY
jgi:DNA-binding transcriptional regulator YhcF (GntR family)